MPEKLTINNAIKILCIIYMEENIIYKKFPKIICFISKKEYKIIKKLFEKKIIDIYSIVLLFSIYVTNIYIRQYDDTFKFNIHEFKNVDKNKYDEYTYNIYINNTHKYFLINKFIDKKNDSYDELIKFLDYETTKNAHVILIYPNE